MATKIEIEDDLPQVSEDKQPLPSSPSIQKDVVHLRKRSNASEETHSDDTEKQASTSPAEISEGSYRWFVIVVCSITTFWYSGLAGSWGVMQAALLRSTLTHTPTSTVSFVGTVGTGLSVVISVFAMRIRLLIGARMALFLGIILLSLGQILSSFTTSHVGGLFASYSLLIGVGNSLCSSACNTLPPQYFRAKLGLASGVVKLGGGVGAAVLSVSMDAMIQKVGIEWTFRIFGICTLVTAGPASLFVRDRASAGKIPFVDWSLFRDLPYTAIFCANAISSFGMFVPPYFLPLMADSIGLNSTAGAALVGAFGISGAVGRFAGGWLSDYAGPINMLLSTMFLSAVSILSIWSVAHTLGPLLTFSALNGLAIGAVSTLLPVAITTTVARIDSTPGIVAVAIGMATTGGTPGYFIGVPVASYILEASGLGVSSFPERDGRGRARYGTTMTPYRPAIFYAGAVTLVAAGFVLVARLRLGRDGKKRI